MPRQGVSGALFGLAVITAITRTYIRARILKQWGIEDGLLAFAVVCLCGTTVLNYLTVDYLYNALDVILLGTGNSLGELLAQIPLMTKEADAAAALWWLVIFPVKLAYLFFFRRLIIRLEGLSRWWWCVMVFMVCWASGRAGLPDSAVPSTNLTSVNRCQPSSPASPLAS